jgi:hypothetical protein
VGVPGRHSILLVVEWSDENGSRAATQRMGFESSSLSKRIGVGTTSPTVLGRLIKIGVVVSAFIRGSLIKIGVVVSAFLGWNIFHFDIHNAFQTCPDNVSEQDRTWLCINQTWLDFYREHHPLEWPKIQALLDKKHRPEQFAVEMFMFVQGRANASCKWGELIDKFVCDNLGLIANRAEPCTYSGIYRGQPVILCQATNDFLFFCHNKTKYDAMITVFWLKWTVHALDKVKIFSGISFICSPCCITMDQTHKVKQVIIDVFETRFDKQSLSG